MTNLFYKEPIIRIVKAARQTGKTRSLLEIAKASKQQGHNIITVSEIGYLNEYLGNWGIKHTHVNPRSPAVRQLQLKTLTLLNNIIIADELKDLNFLDEIIDTLNYKGDVYVAYTPVNKNHIYTGKYKSITTVVKRSFTKEQEELLAQIKIMGYDNFMKEYWVE